MKCAYEIAKEIRVSDDWNFELCGELCKLAGLEKEWEEANGETFEFVLEEAAEILGVEII